MLHKDLPPACATYDGGLRIFAPFFSNVCSSMSVHTHTGAAHVSVNKLIVGDYCICVHEPVFVRANKNELRTKDLPLVSTVSCVRGCVSVFATFGSVLSVGDGILFVLVMSAAARSHGPAWTQGGSLFDSCSLAASVNSV